MKILLIGAPGSGKTTIARFISQYLHMKHVECDVFFREGLDVRERVQEEIKDGSWVVEGHISKVHDIVIPEASKIIVIEDLRLRSLFRALKRDWMRPHRAWFNIQYYDRMNKKREEIIKKIAKTRKADLIYLDNFPDLSESKLAAFCESLKSSEFKTF